MAPPKPPRPGSLLLKPWYAFTEAHKFVYRLTGGRIGGKFGKAPILLLHHVGRKTGKSRVSPLLYLPDGDDVVIVASMGGSDSHPSWWINLRASPETTVEIGREKRAVTAELTGPEERARPLAEAGRDVSELRRLSVAHEPRNPGRDPPPSLT